MAKKQNDNTLTILSHILGLITGFIGPLIIYLVTKNKNDKEHARRALNWQLSFLIYAIVSFILMLVLIGFLLIFALIATNLIFCIIAAVKASNNEYYDYPLSINFVSN